MAKSDRLLGCGKSASPSRRPAFLPLECIKKRRWGAKEWRQRMRGRLRAAEGALAIRVSLVWVESASCSLLCLPSFAPQRRFLSMAQTMASGLRHHPAAAVIARQPFVHAPLRPRMRIFPFRNRAIAKRDRGGPFLECRPGALHAAFSPLVFPERHPKQIPCQALPVKPPKHQLADPHCPGKKPPHPCAGIASGVSNISESMRCDILMRCAVAMPGTEMILQKVK